MTLLAALSVGVCCASGVAAVVGILPHRVRLRTPRAAVAERARTWLQQAGLATSPLQFVGACAFAGFGSLLALAAVTGSTFVAIVPSLSVALLPRSYYARRRRERLRLIQAAWPDGLRDVLASIASGRSLTQAVNALAATGPEPLRAAFRRFPELGRVLGTAPALELMKEELADPTSDRIVEVLILAHERGGAIVRTIVEDLVEATTADLKLIEELETEGLEMKINARAVVVLPWFVLVALTARPGPFRDFYRSSGGVTTLVAGAVLSAVGVVFLDRLGRAAVEERVLRRGGTW